MYPARTSDRTENDVAPVGPRRILIVTDAWAPQVNGVVRTLETLVTELQRLGHDVRTITPKDFSTFPMPTYPEIRLAVFPRPKIRRILEEFRPDAIHIATEGTLGLAARNLCVERGQPFTTSFHTKFPEYVHARFRVPTRWTYALMRWFHAPATAVMVATRTLEDELTALGFKNLRIWSRGVDVEGFKPGPKDWLTLPRPIFLYVGRVAVEKNVEAFLSLDLPGSKLVVGDGPQTAELKQKFPQAHFAGAKFGAELARYYAASDVFVFPSKTDTFGLVILEALASGLPVAAYPVLGPKDILTGSAVGALDEDLGRAARAALAIAPDDCRRFAEGFSWRACTQQFLSNLAPPLAGA
ncbi:MAG TPA: alpha-mannosyltransferase [Alphaproteobacteria bacterium]|nr:alpha-mannosyltransferase [Alphaproteobacteria bacterium]HAJ47159.1 alpha-mannosyltransferase [Alphaproteobacteria bacterium]